MARPKKDLTDMKFGNLLVIGPASNPGGPPKWDCRCDCGVVITAYGGNLQSGGTNRCSRSCTGVQTKALVKVAGGQILPPDPMGTIRKYDKFGILTVEGDEDKAVVKCFCGCGNPRAIMIHHATLSSSNRLNCGECTKHKPPFRTLWCKPDTAPGISKLLVGDFKSLGHHMLREEGTNKILWQHPDFPAHLDSSHIHYRLSKF